MNVSTHTLFRPSYSLDDSKADQLVNVSVAAGGISPEYQPQVYSKDDRPLVSASRSGLLHFSHPYHREFLPVFRSTPRLGATIQEQLGPEADERLGKPGHRVNFGLSLGLCKVYAEVGRFDYEIGYKI